ncbi:MAG TPA: hypothetical protein PLF26_17820 [Blastocatellia bacterium]|nr:hypothetical protein [Blastocatellia bacterium]
MALTFSTTNPPQRGQNFGQFFIDLYPQTTAGASGNTITLSASRVISVMISGIATGDIIWAYSRPTLTLSNLVDTKVYDIWVVHD